MDALVLLVGEFLAPLAAVAHGLLIVPAAVCLELACEAVFLVLALAGRRRAAPGAVAPAPSRAPAWLRRARLAVAAVVGLAILVPAVLQLFFFEASLRWVLGRVHARTGIETTFASASGNLFIGRVTLTGLTVRRTGNDISDFELRADGVDAELDVGSLRVEPVRVDSLRVARLRGAYECVGKVGRIGARPPFVIGRFLLEDAQLTVLDRSQDRRVRLEVGVDSWESRPLRSRWAIFDSIFQSNARGAVDGTPFSIRSAEIPEGPESAWQVARLPAVRLGTLFGGPFAWLTAGTMDLDVRVRRRAGEGAGVRLEWQLAFRGTRVEVPDGAAGLPRLEGRIVASLVERRGGAIDIRFRQDLDADRFKAAGSLGETGLWAAAGEEVRKELTRQGGADPDAIRHVGAQVTGGFLRLLDWTRGRVSPAAATPPRDGDAAK